MNLVHVYTREEAINDGVLIRFVEFARQEGFESLVDQIDFIGANATSTSQLGELVITAGASDIAHAADLVMAIVRHQSGDWGDVSEEDRNANDVAAENGARLLSTYMVDSKNEPGKQTKVWIITEASREATTILLPNEY